MQEFATLFSLTLAFDVTAVCRYIYEAVGMWDATV